MLRYLQTVIHKPVEIVRASAACKRGAILGYNADGTVSTNGTLGMCLIDNAANYDGINAVVTPTDAMFEDIAANDLCLKVVPLHGEHYATNQITATSLTAGDGLVASDGKLVAAGDSDTPIAYFVGAYNDPDFDDMYEIYFV